MYSVTLQTSDNVITSGDKLGQLSFAASAESDGSAAILIAGSVYAQAEGGFQSASNPTSIVIATAAADASSAVDRLKVNEDGHLLPMANDSYDLGAKDFGFSEIYASGGLVLGQYTPGDTTNKLYNEGGTLKFNGSEVGGAGGTPGGADTNVQYNDGGSFGGESDFTYNATTNTLTVPTGKFDVVNFTNGDANVFVGNSVSRTSQDFNVIIGNSAGSTNLFTGNIGVGYRSLNANASSFTTYNVCLGYQTMYSSQGGRNVAIGYEAMYNVGSNNLIQTNIGIGQRALAAIDGDDNIEITTIYGPSDNTGIGTTVSDRLNIGHTIFGDLANRKIRIGMSGVATSFDTSPDATLEVLPESASDLVLLAKGTNLQSANIQEWRDAYDTTLLAVGSGGGLEIPDNVPGITTNKLYNNGGTLTFNGSAVGGGISNIVEDTTPQLGGDLDLNGNQILDCVTEASAAGNTSLIALAAASQTATIQEWQSSATTKLLAVGPDGGLEIPSNTPSTTTNKLFYDGSTLRYGSNDIIDSSMIGAGLQWQPLANTLAIGEITTSEFADATLVIESEGIASNDNDTTIPTSAAVRDYVDNNTGLSNIVEDTSPQLGGNLDAQNHEISGVHAMELVSNTPAATANMLYNDGTTLKFNGEIIPESDPITGASGVHNFMVLDQPRYDSITPDANTIYFIV